MAPFFHNINAAFIELAPSALLRMALLFFFSKK